MDQEDSCYTLTPGIVHQDKPAIFGSQDTNPVASHTFTGSQDAGMYTQNDLKGFWDSIPINAATRTAIKKFSQNLFVFTNAQESTDGSHYYTLQTEFFVDEMISPGYFKDQFLDTFGPVVYVLEHCGIYFSVFFFIKFMVDVVVMIVPYTEIDGIYGKRLLVTLYSLVRPF